MITSILYANLTNLRVQPKPVSLPHSWYNRDSAKNLLAKHNLLD